MVAEGNKLLAAASGVEHSMVLGFIEICRKKSIDYVVAPYEADAELAFLLTQGHADFVISEDSDLLAYGCKKMVINPLNGTTVPLMRWEDTPNFQKTKEYHITCGNILSREYAINLALGNVNPLDSKTVNSTFQLPSKEGL
ncbi:exonuclease 1-like [Stylophora pistillata]|uniref:exonuclease 1-like n=1 Tax=Stylophora pistillata TaxID=50429 RepID=UPI000C043D56|nr:exonuclease 1-like [Stylophora pistillata]